MPPLQMMLNKDSIVIQAVGATFIVGGDGSMGSYGFSVARTISTTGSGAQISNII